MGRSTSGRKCDSVAGRWRGWRTWGRGRGCKHEPLYSVFFFIDGAEGGERRRRGRGLRSVDKSSECGRAWETAETHDGPAASSSSLASPPVALGPVGRACTRLRVRRRGRRGFVERVCTCGGHQSRLILFFSFTAKCGVSAPTCVRVWAGGDSAFFLIASLSFCLAYHRVRGGMGY